VSRPKAPNGVRPHLLLVALRESPEASDDGIGAELGVSQQAVSESRRRLGVPAVADRDRWEVDAQIGRCRRCEGRWMVIPWDQYRTACPACSGAVVVSSARLRRK